MAPSGNRADRRVGTVWTASGESIQLRVAEEMKENAAVARTARVAKVLETEEGRKRGPEPDAVVMGSDPLDSPRDKFAART